MKHTGSIPVEMVAHVDLRQFSAEKLRPPFPLPHVSRKALARVKDWIPVPEVCPYCQGPVLLVSNSVIYGRQYGDWPYAYLCAPCDAYVGLHPNTDLPLGTLANAELREARKRAKARFYTMMKRLRLTRKQAYPILAEAMGYSLEACHFGMFGPEACKLAEEACIRLLEASNG